MPEVMWTPVYFVLQAKSTEPSWVKQKGQRVYSRILRLKANCQVFGRQMSSQCFEGILTRYSTCPNKHAHHSEYSAAHSCVAKWQLVKDRPAF